MPEPKKYYSKQDILDKLDYDGKENFNSAMTDFQNMLNRVRSYGPVYNAMRKNAINETPDQRQFSELAYAMDDLTMMMSTTGKTSEEYKVKAQDTLAGLKDFLRKPVVTPEGKETNMYQLMRSALASGELHGFNRPADKPEDLDNGLALVDKLLGLDLNMKELNPDYDPKLPFTVLYDKEVEKKKQEQEKREQPKEPEPPKQPRKMNDATRQRIIQANRRYNPTVPTGEVFESRFGGNQTVHREFEAAAKLPYQVFKSIEDAQEFKGSGKFKKYLNAMNTFATASNDAGDALDDICDFRTYLKQKDNDGKTVYDHMKEQCRLQGEQALQDFYNALDFYDETLNLNLQIKTDLDPDYQPNRERFDLAGRVKRAKSKETGKASVKPDGEDVVPRGKNGMPLTWGNYALDHIQNRKPKNAKETVDFLAKAMVGTVKSFEYGMGAAVQGGAGEPFSLKRARALAESLKKNLTFKEFCKDTEKVKQCLSQDDPGKLFNTSLNMIQPFREVKAQDCRHVLENLKLMAGKMDASPRRSDKWKAMVNSLKTIDPNASDKIVQQKLQEIYDNTKAYNKGKKSERSKADEQERFDESLDILAELATVGDGAKLAAQAVFSRTNEVRKKKGQHEVKMEDFGVGRKLLPNAEKQNEPQKNDDELQLL